MDDRRKAPLPWRKIWVQETESFAGLSLYARLLGGYLLKLCDDTGAIHARSGGDVVASILLRLRTNQGERRVMREALAEIVESGYLTLSGDRAQIVNFALYQGHETADNATSHVRELSASRARVVRELSASRAPVERELSASRVLSDDLSMRNRPNSGSQEKEVEEEIDKETDPDRAGEPREVSALQLDLAPPEEKPDSKTLAVCAVFAHYRNYHKRAFPKPLPKSKEWRLIRERMDSGHTVEDLKLAIDGFHRSPFHLGQNDRRTRYLDLDLIVRNDSQVAKGIGFASEPPPAPASQPPQAPRHQLKTFAEQLANLKR